MNKSEKASPFFFTIRCYIYSAGAILTLTAVAKLVSAGGNARVLQVADPIVAISFRKLLLLVGLLELIIALYCFLGRSLKVKIGLLAWLATIFFVYRIGLVWVDFHKPCSCLGNLSDALHISPHAADIAMKIVLGYLLAGSYTSGYWFWLQIRKTNPPPSLTCPLT